jgi:hypothetical protein
VGMFEYVVVLTSIVIGLALTHLMQGVAGLIQHPGRVRVWWVHLVWVAFLFLSTIFWWWWEFHLRDIRSWTFQLYIFVVGYAFYMYLICALLFPRDLHGYEGFKDYFLSRRYWFFGMLIGWLAIDVLDTWWKGPAHVAALGVEYWVSQAGFALLCVVAMLSPRERVQAAIAVLVFGYQVVRVLRFYDQVS